MRTIVLILTLLLASLASAQSYTPSQIRNAIRQAGGAEQFMAKMANRAAMTTGRMIDDQTELFSVQSLEKTIVYYSRLPNLSKNDIADLRSLRKNVAERNAPSVCTAPVASILIHEHGAEYKYIAYSKSREYLFDYAFNRQTCAPDYRW